MLKPAAGGTLLVKNYLGKQYGIRIIVSAFWVSTTPPTVNITITAKNPGNTNSVTRDSKHRRSNSSPKEMIPEFREAISMQDDANKEDEEYFTKYYQPQKVIWY